MPKYDEEGHIIPEVKTLADKKRELPLSSQLKELERELEKIPDDVLPEKKSQIKEHLLAIENLVREAGRQLEGKLLNLGKELAMLASAVENFNEKYGKQSFEAGAELEVLRSAIDLLEKKVEQRRVVEPEVAPVERTISEEEEKRHEMVLDLLDEALKNIRQGKDFTVFSDDQVLIGDELVPVREFNLRLLNEKQTKGKFRKVGYTADQLVRWQKEWIEDEKTVFENSPYKEKFLEKRQAITDEEKKNKVGIKGKKEDLLEAGDEYEERKANFLVNIVLPAWSTFTKDHQVSFRFGKIYIDGEVCPRRDFFNQFMPPWESLKEPRPNQREASDWLDEWLDSKTRSEDTEAERKQERAAQIAHGRSVGDAVEAKKVHTKKVDAPSKIERAAADVSKEIEEAHKVKNEEKKEETRVAAPVAVPAERDMEKRRGVRGRDLIALKKKFDDATSESEAIAAIHELEDAGGWWQLVEIIEQLENASEEKKSPLLTHVEIAIRALERTRLDSYKEIIVDANRAKKRIDTSTTESLVEIATLHDAYYGTSAKRAMELLAIARGTGRALLDVEHFFTDKKLYAKDNGNKEQEELFISLERYAEDLGELQGLLQRSKVVFGKDVDTSDYVGVYRKFRDEVESVKSLDVQQLPFGVRFSKIGETRPTKNGVRVNIAEPDWSNKLQVILLEAVDILDKKKGKSNVPVEKSDTDNRTTYETDIETLEDLDALEALYQDKNLSPDLRDRVAEKMSIVALKEIDTAARMLKDVSLDAHVRQDKVALIQRVIAGFVGVSEDVRKHAIDVLVDPLAPDKQEQIVEHLDTILSGPPSDPALVDMYHNLLTYLDTKRANAESNTATAPKEEKVATQSPTEVALDTSKSLDVRLQAVERLRSDRAELLHIEHQVGSDADSVQIRRRVRTAIDILDKATIEAYARGKDGVSLLFTVQHRGQKGYSDASIEEAKKQLNEVYIKKITSLDTQSPTFDSEILPYATLEKPGSTTATAFAALDVLGNEGRADLLADVKDRLQGRADSDAILTIDYAAAKENELMDALRVPASVNMETKRVNAAYQAEIAGANLDDLGLGNSIGRRFIFPRNSDVSVDTARVAIDRVAAHRRGLELLDPLVEAMEGATMVPSRVGDQEIYEYARQKRDELARSKKEVRASKDSFLTDRTARGRTDTVIIREPKRRTDTLTPEEVEEMRKRQARARAEERALKERRERAFRSIEMLKAIPNKKEATSKPASSPSSREVKKPVATEKNIERSVAPSTAQSRRGGVEALKALPSRKQEDRAVIAPEVSRRAAPSFTVPERAKPQKKSSWIKTIARAIGISAAVGGVGVGGYKLMDLGSEKEPAIVATSSEPAKPKTSTTAESRETVSVSSLPVELDPVRRFERMFNEQTTDQGASRPRVVGFDERPAISKAFTAVIEADKKELAGDKLAEGIIVDFDKKYGDMITHVLTENKVPESLKPLFISLALMESQGKEKAVAKTGGRDAPRGLFQVKPSTFELRVKKDKPDANIFSPEDNTEAAVREFAAVWSKYQDPAAAILAYVTGENSALFKKVIDTTPGKQRNRADYLAMVLKSASQVKDNAAVKDMMRVLAGSQLVYEVEQKQKKK